MLSAAALVQVTWAPRLEIAGAFPNLVLLAVIAVTWRRGLMAGLLAACAGGLTLDLTSAGAIGPHALALLLGVYSTGFWIRNVDAVNAVHAAISASLATLLYSLVLVASSLVFHTSSASAMADVQLALAAAAYSALLAPVVLEVVRRLDSSGRSPAAP